MRDGLPNINAKHLWNDFISGNEKSLEIIYESHIQVLFKYGSHFSSDEELIKDSIQDLFIELLNCRSRLGKIENIKAYLCVSLRRTIVKKIQEKGKIKVLNISDFNFDYSLRAEDSHESQMDEQRLESLEREMKKLSNRQREAVYLKFVVGLNYDELSEILHINYQACRNLICRSVEELRKSLLKSDILLLFFPIVKENYPVR